ncbi:MAG: hypothetical protein GX444_00200 [Myxococcales bacterium]|nr:hypothetical protein [Myxococcales bacterium]
MNRRIGLLLALLLVLAVLADRLPLLYYSEYVYDEEEYKTGSIAALIMAGPELPLLEYQPGDYEGGTLLFGLLTIPYFLLFGKTYLALKGVALTTTVLMALFASWFAWRRTGWPGGLATGALFLLPPAAVLQIGLLPWGNYAENAMLSLAAFLLVFRQLAAPRQTIRDYLLHGVFFGLGVWIHYGFAVTVLWLLVLWWLARPAGAGFRHGMAVLAGALVGLLPWFLYNLTHDWRGLGRLTDAVGKSTGLGRRLASGFGRLWHLWTNDLASGLHFHGFSVPAIQFLSYGYLILALFLFGMSIAFYRRKLAEMGRALLPGSRRVEADAAFGAMFPIGFVLLYSVVFSFSDYGLLAPEWGLLDPESHAHIFILYPMLLLAGGLAVGAAWPGRWRYPALAALVGLLGLGAVAYAGLLTPVRPQAERLKSNAYDRDVIYMEIGIKWGAEHERIQQIERRLSGPALQSFVFGAGIKYGLDHARQLNIAVDKCAAQPDPLLPYCWFGIGVGLYEGRQLPVEELDALVRRAPSGLQPWLILGGCTGNIWAGHPDHPLCAEASRIDVGALVPPDSAAALRQFVAGHLAMAEVRPAKQ